VSDGLLERPQRVIHGAVDLRLGAERIRVLDPQRAGIARALLNAGEQLPHPRRDRGLARAVA